MASFFKKLKAAATIGNNDSWSNPEPRKQAPASTPSPAQVQAIRTAKFGKYANNPNAVAEFTKSNAPVQFNAVRAIPSTLKTQSTGLALGLTRSGVGTGQAVSGLYDLATPGKGTNRFSQNLDKLAKNIDSTAKAEHVGNIYKAGQIGGDALTMLAGGAVAKGGAMVGAKIASKAPVLAKPGIIASNANKLINNAVIDKTANLAKGNFGQKIIANTARNVANPKYQAVNLGWNAVQMGKDASTGKDISPQRIALDTAIGGVGMPLGGAIAGQSARAVAGKVLPSLDRAMGGVNKAVAGTELTFKDKNGKLVPQAGTRQAGQSIIRKLSDVKNQITDTNAMLKGNQGGYISMGKDGKPFVKVTKDQHLFDNAPPEQHQAIAQKYLNDNFKGKTIQVDGDGNIAIGNRGIGKFTSDSQRLSKETLSDKMRLSTELDNALKVSTKRSTVADRGGRHGSFAKDGFDYRSFKFEVGGKQFVGTVNVAKNGKASNFYDIHPIKELPNKSGSRLSGSPTNGDTVSPNGAPTGTIPNNVPHVNRIRGLDKLNNNQAGFIKLGKPRLTPLKNNQAGFVKVGKETDPLESLKQEALKYKSADEFVEAQITKNNDAYDNAVKEVQSLREANKEIPTELMDRTEKLWNKKIVLSRDGELPGEQTYASDRQPYEQLQPGELGGKRHLEQIFSETKKPTSQPKPPSPTPVKVGKGETPLAKSERLHQEKLAKNNLTQNEYAALHQKVTDLENKASDLHHNVGKAMDAEPRKADGTFANPTQPKVRKAIDDWSKALDEHLKALNAVRKIDGQDPIVLGNRSIGDKVPVIPDPTNVKIKQPNNGSKIPVRKEVVQGDTVTRTNVNPNVKAREQRFSVADDGQLLPDSKGATRVFTNEKGSVTHIRVGDEVYNLKDIGDLTNIKNYGSTVATQRRNIERAFKDNPTTGKRVNELVVDFQQEQATKMIVRQKTLQDGMKQLTDELGISFGVGRHNAKKVSAAIQDFGENKRDYDSLVKEFGKQKADTIVKADNWFRTQYDQLLDEANKELTKYGYDPIPKRDNYYTHFSEPSIWQKFGLKMQEVNDAFGSPIQEATPSGGRGSIPNTLAGQSEYMVPNKKFNRFALRRKGDEHTSNAFEAFEKYLNPTLNNIYMTPAITRARVMTKAIAMENDRVGKDANQVVVQMTEWANHLAGKSNRLGDRQAADTTGFRQALQASNWVQRKVGANSIVGNVATAIIQPIVLAQTAGKAGYKNTMLALLQEASTSHKANAAIRQSEFMRRRYTNLSPVSRGKVQRSADVASVPLKVIEETAGRITWQANYNKALEQGLKGKQAIKFADVEAEKTMAGRAIGEKPELYRSKAAGFATQFQLEVNNYVQQVGKEMTPAQVAKTFTAAYGINILLQEATGRSIGFNPIDAAVDSVEILAGDDDGTDKAKKVAQRWAGEIVGNTPMATQALDLFMDDQDVKNVFGTETPIGRYGVGSTYGQIYDNTVGKVLDGKYGEAAAYTAMPWGYSQANKTYKGVKAVVDGEMTDKDGNTTVEVPQTAGNLVRGALFGPSAIKEVGQYYNNIGVKKEDQKPVQNQTSSKAASMGPLGSKEELSVSDQLKQSYAGNKEFSALTNDEQRKEWSTKSPENKALYAQYTAMKNKLGAKEADDIPASLTGTSAGAFTKKQNGFTKEGKDSWYKQAPSEKDKALYDAANAVKGKDWLDLPKSNQTIADYIAYQKKVSKATTNFEKQDAAKEFVRDTYKQYLPENARKLFSGTNYNEDQKLAAIASGELTQADFEKALQLDNMMYEKGLSSSLAISKKIRSKYGYGAPSKSGGGSGGRSSGGRKKSNIKLSDFSVADIYKTTSSHRKKLRDLLEQAKV